MNAGRTCGRYKVYTYTHASYNGRRETTARPSIRAYRRSIKARGHHNFANTPPTYARTPIREEERAGARVCKRCVLHTCACRHTYDSGVCMYAHWNRPKLTPQSCSERFCIRYAETRAPSLYRGLPDDLATL